MNLFGRAIADAYHVKTLKILSGFKFRGEKIRDFSRDKDVILATEMCLHYKQENKTLVDRLYELYEQFVYYKEGLDSFTLIVVAGVKKTE